MKTPLYMMLVVVVLLACPLFGADPNARAEPPQTFAQWMLPGLLDLLAAAGALVGLLGAWALRRLTANMQAKEVRDEAIACLESGVEEAWENYVRGVKASAADGKLTKVERQTARKRALNVAASVARDERVRSLLWAMGEERVAAIIRKIVQARKVAPAMLILAVLLFGATGCTRDVRIPDLLAAEVQTAEIEARTALLGSDPNAVAQELRDSIAVLLTVYDPDHAHLSAQARVTVAEVIAIAEADYRDCPVDPETCRSGLIETHWWLRWLLHTNAEILME